MVDDAALVILADMFPEECVDVLSRALIDTNNDVSLACSMLLSSKDVESTDDPEIGTNDVLQDLFELFPQISRDEIERLYLQQKEQKGEQFDANDVVLDLLSYEAIKHSLEEDKSTLNGSDRSSGSSQWDKTKENVDIIMRFTNVTREDANKYYIGNLFSAPLAIITIIKDSDFKRPVEPKVNSGIQTNKQQPRRVGGRVQGHHGLAHIKKRPELQKENTFEHLSLEEDRVADTNDLEDTLTAEEEILIDSTIENNTMLNAMNPEFIKKANNYYGDKRKLARLIQYLSEVKAAKLTFIAKLDKPVINIQEKFQLRTTSRSSSNGSNKSQTPTTVLRPHMIQGKENFKKAEEMISQFFVSYKLDFHGFFPQEARKITDICLTKWWREELQERELNKGKMTISKTTFMHPVNLITGRGIHSSGGYSKVRATILNYLQENKYVFDEYPSYFIVTGRKMATA
ncbi:Cue2p [Nakaseomyces bracarensis]|uniref:Cue2p n=1 Tax=Nakaseomyces bracarensis TaxID=273131 RepID=UPI003871F50D